MRRGSADTITMVSRGRGVGFETERVKIVYADPQIAMHVIHNSTIM